MVTAAAATVAVTSVAFLVFYNRPDASLDPLGAAMAQLATGKSGVMLEQTRQELILRNAAARTFSVTSVPQVATTPATSLPSSGGGSAPLVPNGPPPNPGSAQAIALGLLPAYGFSKDQFGCLDDLWEHESGWRYNAENPSGAYGIPQALPGSKMASAGPNWQTNPRTQIKWGLGYIKSRYGTPCGAWSFWEANGWY
jgi:hypothetical protein